MKLIRGRATRLSKSLTQMSQFANVKLKFAHPIKLGGNDHYMIVLCITCCILGFEIRYSCGDRL